MYISTVVCKENATNTTNCDVTTNRDVTTNYEASTCDDDNDDNIGIIIISIVIGIIIIGIIGFVIGGIVVCIIIMRAKARKRADPHGAGAPQVPPPAPQVPPPAPQVPSLVAGALQMPSLGVKHPPTDKLAVDDPVQSPDMSTSEVPTTVE